MKFIHGQRTELRYDEMTPLDKAINEYQKKADEYYKKKLEIDKLPPDARKVRQQELNNAKQFLEHQRMNAESYASIQAGLDKYRDKGREITKGTSAEKDTKLEELIQEPHHPASVLAQLLVADGRPKPSGQHSSHHIVPGIGKSREANLARVYMHLLGIQINDPDNGVWLPMYKKHTPHWTMPDAKGHLEYHTIGYENWVYNRIRVRSGEQFVRMELRKIADLLILNKLPEAARKK